MGYHKIAIARGVYGDSSKILEETLEFLDAENQQCKVMVLCELSDLLGAVSGYLDKHYPTISMRDLLHMMELTKSAFLDGDRR